MRIIFMGTPEFSVPTFNAILAAGHDIVACYTKAPRPAGRGQKEKKSPVHLAAEAAGVPVFTPKSLKTADEQALFSSHNADVAVVVAYGLLLPIPVLDAPVHGCLNLHGSMLPRWRGAAPIQRAIMAGDRSTAVQVMAMEEGLDTGPVCMSSPIEISDTMTAGELHDKMMGVGAKLMVEALAALQRGDLDFIPQSAEGATYAKKIEKSEARIDWQQPAAQVHNLIRGLSPFPGAWSMFDVKGKPLRVKLLRASMAEGSGQPGEILNGELSIACGAGAIRVLQVQREGKSVMDPATFLRGTGALTGQFLVSR